MKRLLPLIAAVILTAPVIAGLTVTAGADKARDGVLDLSNETTSLENMPLEGWEWDAAALTLSLSGFSGNGIKLPAGSTLAVSGANDAGAAGIEAPSLKVIGRGKLNCGSLKISGELKIEGVPVTSGAPCEIGFLTVSYGGSVKIKEASAPDAWYVSNPARIVSGKESPAFASDGEDVRVYSLRASAQNGKVSFSVSGSRVSVSAEPDPGFNFAGWTSDDVSFAAKTSPSTSFAQPAGNVTVTANFTRGSSQLKFTAGEGGKIENADGGFTPGETVAVKAVPDKGFRFAGWKASAGTFADASAASTQFTVPAGGAEITASFVKEKYTLTVICSDPAAGKTSIVSGSYYYLDKITLTATASPGTWEFAGWSAPEGSFSNARLATTQFTMPAANVTVTALFNDKSDTKHISVFVSSGGKVLLDGGTELTGSFSQERIKGSKVRLTAVPDPGYTFAGWLQSAVTYKISETPGETVPFKVSEDGMTLEYVMTERSVSFRASFVASSRTLEIASTEGGSATFTDPDPASGSVIGSSVSVGKTLRLEAVPDPGFVFAGWEIEGLPAGTDPAKVISQPNSPQTNLVMPNARIKVTAAFLPESAPLSTAAPESSAPRETVPAPPDSAPVSSGNSQGEEDPGENDPGGENEEGISWPLLAAAAALAALGVALVIRAEKRRREGKLSHYRQLFKDYDIKNLERGELKKYKERTGKTKKGSSGGKDE